LNFDFGWKPTFGGKSSMAWLRGKRQMGDSDLDRAVAAQASDDRRKRSGYRLLGTSAGGRQCKTTAGGSSTPAIIV
jgi:hypothetical protein